MLTLNGTWNQTGTSNITGNVDIDDFRISGSTIETTTSSADLELLANGSGLVKFGINDVDFDQDLKIKDIQYLDKSREKVIILNQ